MDDLEIFPVHRAVTGKLSLPSSGTGFIILFAPVVRVRGIVGILPCSCNWSSVFLVKAVCVSILFEEEFGENNFLLSIKYMN